MEDVCASNMENQQLQEQQQPKQQQPKQQQTEQPSEQQSDENEEMWNLFEENSFFFTDDESIDEDKEDIDMIIDEDRKDIDESMAKGNEDIDVSIAKDKEDIDVSIDEDKKDFDEIIVEDIDVSVDENKKDIDEDIVDDKEDIDVSIVENKKDSDMTINEHKEDIEVSIDEDKEDIDVSIDEDKEDFDEIIVEDKEDIDVSVDENKKDIDENIVDDKEDIDVSIVENKKDSDMTINEHKEDIEVSIDEDKEDIDVSIDEDKKDIDESMAKGNEDIDVSIAKDKEDIDVSIDEDKEDFDEIIVEDKEDIDVSVDENKKDIDMTIDEHKENIEVSIDEDKEDIWNLFEELFPDDSKSVEISDATGKSIESENSTKSKNNYASSINSSLYSDKTPQDFSDVDIEIQKNLNVSNDESPESCNKRTQEKTGSTALAASQAGNISTTDIQQASTTIPTEKQTTPSVKRLPMRSASYKRNQKKYSKEARKRKRASFKRCDGCLSKNCESKQNSQSSCGIISICHLCLIRVTPSTVQYCANGCRKRLKFSEKVCPSHNELKCFGNICPKCHPSSIIRSVDAADIVNKYDNPPYEDVLMCISEGVIHFDRLGIYKKGTNKDIHLFRGNLVGCGDVGEIV